MTGSEQEKLGCCNCLYSTAYVTIQKEAIDALDMTTSRVGHLKEQRHAHRKTPAREQKTKGRTITNMKSVTHAQGSSWDRRTRMAEKVHRTTRANIVKVDLKLTAVVS